MVDFFSHSFKNKRNKRRCRNLKKKKDANNDARQLLLPMGIKFSLTFAFCNTLPFVGVNEAGLFLRAVAELTGAAESALAVLLEGWGEEEDVDDAADNDRWGVGRVVALV